MAILLRPRRRLFLNKNKLKTLVKKLNLEVKTLKKTPIRKIYKKIYTI